MSKEWRQAKRAYKAKGYTGTQAKRFASGGAGETEIILKKGGKLPSNNKKKHRGAIKK
jgi:hypothetical protein